MYSCVHPLYYCSRAVAVVAEAAAQGLVVNSNKKSQLFGLAGTKVILVHIVPRTLRCRSTPREYNRTPRHFNQSVRKKIVPRPDLGPQINGGLLGGRTGHVSTAHGLIRPGGGDARPGEHSTLFYPSLRQGENTNFKR